MIAPSSAAAPGRVRSGPVAAAAALLVLWGSIVPPALASTADRASAKLRRAQASLTRCADECGRLQHRGARTVARLRALSDEIERLLAAGDAEAAKTRYARLRNALPAVRSKAERAHRGLAACRTMIERARFEFERARTAHPEAVATFSELHARLAELEASLSGGACAQAAQAWSAEVSRAEALANRFGGPPAEVGAMDASGR